MANNDYEIYHSNGIDKIIVKENLVNHETSVGLVGHGQPNYGPDQDTNFLHLLENFASRGTDNEPEPSNPVLGQIWYKILGENRFELNVCSALDTAGKPTWSKMAQVVTSTSGGNYSNGDLYYDPDSKKLKVYDEVNEPHWIAVGPTDVVHTQHVFGSILIPPQQESATYDDFDMSLVSENISETGDDSIQGNGSLSLVKMTILAKEFNKDGVISAGSIKSCAWTYKFVIRCTKVNEDMNYVEMIGAPNYELIAQKPEDLDWRTNIELRNDTGEPHLSIKVSLNTRSNYYVLVGFDTEITRI